MVSEDVITAPLLTAEAGESGARDVKGGDLKRVCSPSVGRFRVRDHVRQVWGSKYQAGNKNLSLPRPRESRPPCRKSVRQIDVPVSTSYVPWTKNPEYVLNKAKTRGDYEHVVGKGVIAYNVSNVDASKCASNVNVSESAASKNVEQKVSEVTQGDMQLKLGIDQMMEFMKMSETFKTGKQALAEQQKQKEQKKKKIVYNFSDVEPDDPVSVDTDDNANVVATEKSEKSKTSVGEPDFESVIAETVVISSDWKMEGNDKIVSSNSDADLQDIEMQVNRS